MIVLKAELTTISTLSDGTIKITLGTQEISPKIAGELFGLRKRLLTVGLAENELKQHEITLLQEAKLSIEDVPNGKSQSQRLRGALYVYWEQHDTGYDDFTAFYNNYTNQIINNITSKLEQ